MFEESVQRFRALQEAGLKKLVNQGKGYLQTPLGVRASEDDRKRVRVTMPHSDAQFKKLSPKEQHKMTASWDRFFAKRPPPSEDDVERARKWRRAPSFKTS